MRRRGQGAAFESMIELTNAYYRRRGDAVIEKQEIQTKMIRGKMTYTKKGAPDFMGTLARGKAICFDCKSTAKPSLPLSDLMKRPHQLEFMIEWENTGGIAFYLVEFSAVRRYFMLFPMQLKRAIEEAEMGGRKSIPMESMNIEVKAGTGLAVDYLKPFLEMIAEKIQ